MEQPFCKNGLYLVHGFLVTRAEICAEGLAYLKEQVFGQDVREGPNNIGVVLDLEEAGLDNIGVDHDVVEWVCDA